jgi:hypothetical protein
MPTVRDYGDDQRLWNITDRDLPVKEVVLRDDTVVLLVLNKLDKKAGKASIIVCPKVDMNEEFYEMFSPKFVRMRVLVEAVAFAATHLEIPRNALYNTPVNPVFETIFVQKK